MMACCFCENVRALPVKTYLVLYLLTAETRVNFIKVRLLTGFVSHSFERAGAFVEIPIREQKNRGLTRFVSHGQSEKSRHRLLFFCGLTGFVSHSKAGEDPYGIGAFFVDATVFDNLDAPGGIL
jgi:hypothetical protein